MNEGKKTERRREIIAVCLDCFVEKGLTITTTKDLCTAAKLQNGGIYYYFSTKEEIVLACAEAAIERIEKGAFGVVFEDIRDIKSMMDRLGALADKMSPTMRFLVSVCVRVAGIRGEGQICPEPPCVQIPILHGKNRGGSGLYARRGRAVRSPVDSRPQQLYDLCRARAVYPADRSRKERTAETGRKEGGKA